MLTEKDIDDLADEHNESLAKAQATNVVQFRPEVVGEGFRFDTEEAKVEASIAQSNELLARLQETF